MKLEIEHKQKIKDYSINRAIKNYSKNNRVTFFIFCSYLIFHSIYRVNIEAYASGFLCIFQQIFAS